MALFVSSQLNYFVKLFSLYFIVLIPCFAAVLISTELSWSLICNFTESVLFGILIVLVISFFKKSTFKRILNYILFLFFTFCTYTETVYFLIYKTYFSPSTIFVFFDSNPQEVSEFLAFYSTKPIIVLTFITLLVSVWCLKQLYLLSSQFFTVSKNTIVYSLIFIGIILGFLRLSKLIDYNFPYLFARSYILYQKESKELDVYKKNKNGNFESVAVKPSSAQQVYVLVLGESTTKSHLGVYDYARPTTPLLSAQKDDLLLFQDVISPNTYSVASVTKLLTLANYEYPKATGQGSIIQLANAADFETFWLSNQRPLGPYESLITKLSFSSDHTKFITTVNAGNSNTLDADLLSDLDAVLNQSQSNKIFILLHLIGTHHNYEDRYPPSFNVFNGMVNSNFRSDAIAEKINHYDNAVLYNDFVLNAVIDRLKTLNANSFMLFLSDHGEELYTDLNIAGHNEDTPTKSMYEIPFILWQSEKYKEYRTIDTDVNKPYMSDDLFHGLADLMGIQCNQVDYQRSIFSDRFKERPRIILDSIDYDTAFRSKK
jgi:heptose-I-phosphate ethanolaminephosphotransferase